MPTPPLSMSARLYQERRLPLDQETLRGPGPRLDMSRAIIHTLQMAPPLPAPEALQAEDDHPPDAGKTRPWPHGTEEVL